jgi:hypothetical protein
MTRNTTSSFGALHPIFFFIVVYGISLFLAFFVCRTIYYGVNESEGGSAYHKKAGNTTALAASVAYK